MVKEEELKSSQPDAFKIAEEKGFVCLYIKFLIMREPVLAADGKTYEKEAIEYWFTRTNKSPATGVVLKNSNIIPQEVLQQAIHEFLKKNKHLIVGNHVYLPRRYLEDFAAAVREKNIEKIKEFVELDIRLLTLSAQQAIQKCGTLYMDEGQASDRSGFHLACEVADVNIVTQMLEMLTANDVPLDFIVAQKPPQWNPIVLNQALYSAIEKGDEKECGRLLSIGADANFKTKKGKLLHFAVKKQKKKIVELLLAFKADINAQSSEFYQKTPLHVAVDSGDLEITKILLEAGADTKIKAEKKSGSDLIGDRSLPLHIACRNGNESMVKLLLKYADIEGKDNYGNHKDVTPLIWASAKGHVGVVKLFCKSGANVDTKDNLGMTALHWAVREGQLEVIKLLMKHGADHKAKDPDGNTPAEIALRQKDQNQGKSIADLISQLHRERKLNAIKRTEELEKRVQEQEARIIQLENLVQKPIVGSQLKKSRSLDSLSLKSRFFETTKSSENNQQIAAVSKQANEINTEDAQENLQRGIQVSLEQAEEDEVKQPTNKPK